ncbi:hypothetical protein [Plasmodium yoelii yoelii]|uniref:Uncharacterized protein n=1 Tax=Plasmodium yoelii yoelii TaxID=73239 RepID=Q7RAA7_PLAYO|nr:hypothetical protein [Plasmodium yoelii yoelii]
MFGVIHYQKNAITKKQSSNSETKPLTVPLKTQYHIIKVHHQQ